VIPEGEDRREYALALMKALAIAQKYELREPAFRLALLLREVTPVFK